MTSLPFICFSVCHSQFGIAAHTLVSFEKPFKGSIKVFWPISFFKSLFIPYYLILELRIITNVSGWLSSLWRCTQVALSPRGVGSNSTLIFLLVCQGSGSFLFLLAHLSMDIYYQTFQASPPPLKPHLSFNSSRSWPPVHWWRKLEGARSRSNSVDLVMGSAIQSLWSGTMLGLPHLWQSNRGHWHSCAALEARGTRSPTFDGRVPLRKWKI